MAGTGQPEKGVGAERGERRPDVALDVLFDDGLLFVAVSNIGDTAALRVSCAFGTEVRGLAGTLDLSRLPLFRNIEFLAPGREIRTLLDTSAAYFARGEPTVWSVTVTYRDAGGRPYETTIRHDLAIYRELAYVPREEQRDA